MMVNINNIALISTHEYGVEVTLNTKDRNNNPIVFVTRDEYNSVSESIYNMDQSQDRNLDD